MKRLVAALLLLMACGGSVTVYHKRQAANPAMCDRWSVDQNGIEVEAVHTVVCPDGVPRSGP